jgi:N-acetylmuramoyl-L-alanine amidase
MNSKLPLRLAVLVTAVFTNIIPFNSVKASTFDEQPIDQTKVIAIARPYGSNKYDLLVIEQIPGKKACWQESGSQPVLVEPLLLNYDFTGICRRSTDSNGYSIRISGKDYGLDYLLRLIERNGELVLIGTNRANPSQEIVVGTTQGLSKGFLKIILNPGWQFTRRTFQGRALGHFYFSRDQVPSGSEGSTSVSPTPVSPTPGSSTIVFADIATDTYKSEIEQAVALGFVSGFKEDATFRPQVALTREQLVSLVIEALSKVSQIKIDPSQSVSSQPYPDIESSRWSAAKIQWAKENQIIKGYPDGTFRPTQAVTRAELMAVLRQAAVYVRVQRGLSPELAATQKPKSFADTSNHWAEDLISQMSAYCQVASPVNETGSDFAPNDSALRNYAAAATLRMLNCIKNGVLIP